MNKRKNSGITIIALTITIILLLIIASITISIGLNSLKDSKENLKLSELKMVQQAVLENYEKYITTNNDRRRTCDYSDMNILKLRVEPNNTETITLQYNKTSGSDDTDKEIHFHNIVKDYDLYIQDTQNYNEFSEVVIDL